MAKRLSRAFTKTCSKCGKEYVTCEIMTCPINNQPICRYCCMKCGKHTVIGTGIGCQMLEERGNGRKQNH